ncbi:MAG: hypothetical protein ABSD89_09800 [Halobacteriota archaeon]
MKPNKLVVGQKYEAKLTRKDTKRGDDGFRPVIYEGTKDEGEDYQSFLFCETDKDAAGYSDVPWEFYIEDLGKRKKARPLTEPVAQHKCQFAMWIDESDGGEGGIICIEFRLSETEEMVPKSVPLCDRGETINTDDWPDAFVLTTEDNPRACGVPTNMLWTDDDRHWYWLCERHYKKCRDLSPM